MLFLTWQLIKIAVLLPLYKYFRQKYRLRQDTANEN